MIRPLLDLPPGVIGFEAIGEVQADDYRDVLRPAIEAAAAKGEVHLVLVLGSEFGGYSAGAAWEDTKLGVEHMRAVARTAVVTDVGWLEHMVAAFGWMVPGQIRRFPLAAQTEAVAWTAGGEHPSAPSLADMVEPVPTGALVVDPVEPVGVAPLPAEGTEESASEEPVETSSAATDGLTDPGAVEDGPAAIAEEAVDASPAVEPVMPVVTGAVPQDPQALTHQTPVAPEAAVAPSVPQAVAPSTPAVPAQWAPDPSGRHQHRWWDGERWTEHVADNGVSGVDRLG